jgi:hypothetical protein
VATSQGAPLLLRPRGERTCGAFILAVGSDQFNTGIRSNQTGKEYWSNAAVFAEWIMGYISAQDGANPYEKQIKFDASGLLVWIKNYCDKNPTKSVIRASNEFLAAHGLNAVRSE